MAAVVKALFSASGSLPLGDGRCGFRLVGLHLPLASPLCQFNGPLRAGQLLPLGPHGLYADGAKHVNGGGEAGGAAGSTRRPWW